MFKEIQKCKTEFYKFDVDSSSEEYELNDKIYSKNIRDKYCIYDPKFFRFISFSKDYIGAQYVAIINRLFALPKNVTIKRIFVFLKKVFNDR